MTKLERIEREITKNLERMGSGAAKGLENSSFSFRESLGIVAGFALVVAIAFSYLAYDYHRKFPSDMWWRFLKQEFDHDYKREKQREFNQQERDELRFRKNQEAAELKKES